MNKLLYVEYAGLEEARDVIETKQKILKTRILDEMRAEFPDYTTGGKNGVELDVGSFTLKRKVSYKFSKAAEALEKQAKDAKAEEIAKKLAKITGITEFVTFQPVKKVV